jgi:hypothetical protein
MSDLTRKDVHAMIAIGIKGPTTDKIYWNRPISEDACDCCGKKADSIDLNLVLDWLLCEGCDVSAEHNNLPHVAKWRYYD